MTAPEDVRIRWLSQLCRLFEGRIGEAVAEETGTLSVAAMTQRQPTPVNLDRCIVNEQRPHGAAERWSPSRDESGADPLSHLAVHRGRGGPLSAQSTAMDPDFSSDLRSSSGS